MGIGMTATPVPHASDAPATRGRSASMVTGSNRAMARAAAAMASRAYAMASSPPQLSGRHGHAMKQRSCAAQAGVISRLSWPGVR